MYANGATVAERGTDKETSIQRLDRYIAEFRRKAIRESEQRTTGHVCLTVNMQDGSFKRRQIVAEEMGQ